MTQSTPTLSANDAGTAKIVYILYMVGLVMGITGIVGVVLAYVNKDNAPEWLKSHYQFQIRTFWIGALYIFVGCLFALLPRAPLLGGMADRTLHQGSPGTG